MRSSVLLLAASLALTSAEAGEAAKQGEENATAYYVAIPDSGSTVHWVGIRRSDSGDPVFDKMGVNSTDLGGHGSEVQMDPSGDQIFVTWGPSEFHYTGGTGKFAGISGEGTWSCTHPRSPDASIELAICTQKSSWKLP